MKEMVKRRAEKYFWISFISLISNSISENKQDGYRIGLAKEDKRNRVFH